VYIYTTAVYFTPGLYHSVGSVVNDVIEYLPDDALALCFSSSQLRLALIVQLEPQAQDI
jgi:hypothetical protein